MAIMRDRLTGGIVEIEDQYVKESLRLKTHDFVDEKIPVRYYNRLENGERDPEDKVGVVKKWSREESQRRLLEDEDAEYISPQDAYDHYVQKKYGSGYEGAAATLGVLDMVSVGAGSSIGELMGLPTREIVAANPWWHGGADLTMTAAMLAGTAALPEAAPLTGSYVSAQGAKYAGLMGLKAFQKVVPPSMWKATLPYHMMKGGKVIQEGLPKVSAKIFGEASEENLKRLAAEGFFSRVGAVGAESFLYSAGYSVNDNLVEYIHGDREQALENISHGIGVGTMIGMALPAAWNVAKGVGIGAWRAGSKFKTKASDFVRDSKWYSDMAEDIAEEAADYGKLPKGMTKGEYKDELMEAAKGQAGRRANQELARNLDGVIDSTVEHLDDGLRLNADILKIEQQGHTTEALEGMLVAVHPGTEGAAATAPLVHQLFAGSFDTGQNKVREGLLETLASQVDQAMSDNGLISAQTPPLSRAMRQDGPPPLIGEARAPNKTIKNELLNIRREVAELQDEAKAWVNERAAALRSDMGDELPFGRDLSAQPEWRQALIRADSATNPRRFDNLVEIMITEPQLLGELDQVFNAKIFSRLEKLSARVHEGILKGRFQDMPGQQDFINNFKKELTEFLTGTKAWEVPQGAFRGVFPFGDPAITQTLAGQKRQLNAMLSHRTESYNSVLEKFAEVDPKKAYTVGSSRRPDRKKIEGFIRGINTNTQKQSLDFLDEMTGSSEQLMEYFHRNFDISPDFDPGWMTNALGRATTAKGRIQAFAEFLKKDVQPALEYADVLRTEHKNMQFGQLTGAVIPDWAAGLKGAVAGGIVGGAPGAVTGGVLAGSGKSLLKTRMAMSPLNAAVKVNRLYTSIQKRDEYTKKWVADHIRSFGKSKYSPVMRWPRVFTTNIIGKSASEPGEYRHIVGARPSESYGRAEYENTKEALKVMNETPGLKDRIVDAIVTDIAGYAPYIADDLKAKVEGYFEAMTKALPQPVSYDMFSDDIEPNDTEIQEFAEVASVYSIGPDAVFRSMSEGTLTPNEWEALEDFYPSTATQIQKHVMETMASAPPGFKDKMPEWQKEQLALVMGMNRFSPQLQQTLLGTFAEEEEENPGPRPQPKWAGDTTNIAQLSGSRATEQRRA